MIITGPNDGGFKGNIMGPHNSVATHRWIMETAVGARHVTTEDSRKFDSQCGGGANVTDALPVPLSKRAQSP